MRELAQLFGLQGPDAGLVGSIISGGRIDPLSLLDDDFSTDTSANWTELLSANTTITRSISGGELSMQVSGGGGGGSFAFDGNDYCLLYKTITGTSWDARARIRVRNTANSGVPAASNFRLFGLHVADPANSGAVHNFLHCVAGTVNGTQNRVEWKTNDHNGGGSNDVSAFNSVASPSTGDCDVDVRIVRNGQTFTLTTRDSTGDLLTASDWSAVVTIDRTSNATPNRTTNGATANLAVSLPTTLRIGFVCYSDQATHDVRGFVDRFVVRTV